MTFVLDKFGNVVFLSTQNVSSENALSSAMKKKEVVKKDNKRLEKPQNKK